LNNRLANVGTRIPADGAAVDCHAAVHVGRANHDREGDHDHDQAVSGESERLGRGGQQGELNQGRYEGSAEGVISPGRLFGEESEEE